MSLPVEMIRSGWICSTDSPVRPPAEHGVQHVVGDDRRPAAVLGLEHRYSGCRRERSRSASTVTGRSLRGSQGDRRSHVRGGYRRRVQVEFMADEQAQAHCINRRTVREALVSAWPAPRKKPPPRRSPGSRPGHVLDQGPTRRGELGKITSEETSGGTPRRAARSQEHATSPSPPTASAGAMSGLRAQRGSTRRPARTATSQWLWDV